MDSAGGCPESLERLFQQLELESERRAKGDYRFRNDDIPTTPSSPEVKTMGLRQEPSESSLRTKRNRRRGSVSITRFGQLHDDFSSKANSPASPKRLSAIAPERDPPFYQTPMGSTSNGSIASGASTDASDEHHITQMQQIVPRQNTISRAVGGMLPRRLSRARSERVIGNQQETNLVIGVSVSEATVEATAEEEGAMETRIVVQRPLRNQPSRLSMAESTPASTGWVSKAKNFTSKFKRKSTAGIPSPEPSSP
ncbi:hypothetical protein EV122DRAFT_212470 [Schizophyllum commune]